MSSQQSDPERVFVHTQLGNANVKRGRITIFFGAVEGVGKRHAMLLSAKERTYENLDLIVGLINTQGQARQEIEDLLTGVEILPPRIVIDIGAEQNVAQHHCFDEEQLIVLRELALRKTTSHVDSHMQRYR